MCLDGFCQGLKFPDPWVRSLGVMDDGVCDTELGSTGGTDAGFQTNEDNKSCSPKPEKIFQTTPKCRKAAPRMGWGGGMAFRPSLWKERDCTAQGCPSTWSSSWWDHAELSCALGTAPAGGWAVLGGTTALGLQKL